MAPFSSPTEEQSPLNTYQYHTSALTGEMGTLRKRTHLEASTDVPADGPATEPSLRQRIRNMWQFANLGQWIYLFGKAVKIDDRLDTDELEAECLKPTSPVLQDIGLALLKFVSSHRGLTLENFDEYTRRQYVDKNPDRNPFGTEEVPAKFTDFDVFTKIRVLHQLTQWAMLHPERLRDRMDETRDIDQTSWRIEPMGWDRQDRTYFVLDDNRVYRLSEPLAQPPLSRKKTKTSRRALRASKRRHSSNTNNTADPGGANSNPSESVLSDGIEIDNGLGGMKWECLAVTLEEVHRVVASFQNTRDENEKVLRDQLQEHLVPILEKQEESRKRRALQQQRELENLAKMANAKRSSRLANKQERQKLEEQAREEEQRQLAEKEAARKVEETRLKLERDREVRLMSREKRIKEREARRRQYEEELSNLSEDSRRTGHGEGRLSQRQLHTEIEKNKQALKQLQDDDAEDDWLFDCECGVYGRVDDGTHSISCERCNVWQHSKCVGVLEAQAEQPRFHFVCSACLRREDAANGKPRPTIKLKVNRSEGAASDPGHSSQSRTLVVEIPSSNGENRAAVRPELAQEKSAALCSDAPHANTGVDGHGRGGSHDGDKPVAIHDTATDAQHESFASSASSGHNSASIARHSLNPRGNHPQDTKPRLLLASSTGEIARPPFTPLGSSSVQEQSPADMFVDAESPIIKPPQYPTYGTSGTSPRRDSAITSSPGAWSNKSLIAAPVLGRQVRGDAGSTEPGVLPPSSTGHSPAKQPSARDSPTAASFKTRNISPVYPPTTTLAPLDQHPILTPPTKQASGPRQSQVPGKLHFS
ncbi:hypothetical protein SODALDRAFT_380509 [Sodiomyces alkalinus F11]|uniref:Zinc finger PHD-type domain-containing protein n=1 Tax=Sodiomyces alkalinus (strain CBS 110278 / VKM F-3762 / F11) TaxID=1314773 RepID=A0A3N2PRA7_SODAK|nr:hypothetical protein SODALDRAFT_380509 [Sodiomyces alkalinus F11]ROT37025.1 hypothetical protein SODALDRAFT_380509 [Sodiomyces alkalinus F11]